MTIFGRYFASFLPIFLWLLCRKVIKLFCSIYSLLNLFTHILIYNILSKIARNVSFVGTFVCVFSSLECFCSFDPFFIYAPDRRDEIWNGIGRLLLQLQLCELIINSSYFVTMITHTNYKKKTMSSTTTTATNPIYKHIQVHSNIVSFLNSVVHSWCTAPNPRINRLSISRLLHGDYWFYFILRFCFLVSICFFFLI